MNGPLGEVGTNAARVAAFIADQRIGYGIPHATSCRALGVSQSWFYTWKDRPVTERQTRRIGLAEQVGALFERSGGTYRSPRIFIELMRAGWRVSVNTVAKIMAELGLAAREVRRAEA